MILDITQKTLRVTKIFKFLLATVSRIARFCSPSYGKIKLDRTKQTQTSNGGKVCQPAFEIEKREGLHRSHDAST